MPVQSRLNGWLQTPPGAYLRHWEAQEFERSVVDVFGYHALQLGLPHVDTLQANRMPNQWLALDDAAVLNAFDGPSQPALKPALFTDFDALPFAEASLDLVTLPHTLTIRSSTAPPRARRK